MAEIRQRWGLTQKELGKAVGASNRVVAYYEGHTAQLPERFQKVAELPAVDQRTVLKLVDALLETRRTIRAFRLAKT